MSGCQEEKGREGIPGRGSNHTSDAEEPKCTEPQREHRPCWGKRRWQGKRQEGVPGPHRGPCAPSEGCKPFPEGPGQLTEVCKRGDVSKAMF